MATTQVSPSAKADELFGNIKNLPTIPVIMQKILASMNDPEVGAKHLAQIITNDQSIATMVIKLVNSSYFGLKGKVESITNAVTLLGFSTIRQILLSVSVCGRFKNGKYGDSFTAESFWTHSIATAILARQLCRTSTSIEPDIGYTVGLIHDIGKLLLLEYHEDLFAKSLEKARTESMEFQRAELFVTGTDHAEIANWLFTKWNFPRPMRRAVKNHHSANINFITPISEDALIGIVHFSNLLAHKLDLGTSGNFHPEWDEAGFKKFLGKGFQEMGIDREQIGKEVGLHLELLGIATQQTSRM